MTTTPKSLAYMLKNASYANILSLLSLLLQMNSLFVMLLVAIGLAIVEGYSFSVSRRNFGLASVGSLIGVANAAGATETISSTTPYSDDTLRIKFNRPSSWDPTTQELPDRRKLTMFISPSNKDNNVFINATPVRDDYTSLAALGSLENVGMATILPKGELQGSPVESEMLSMKTKKGAYYYDYTVSVPGQETRRLSTIFLMKDAPKGYGGKTLVTLTVNTVKGEVDEKSIAGIIDSFESS